WLALSYSHAAWMTAVAFASASVVFFAIAPMVAAWFGPGFSGVGALATYAAPTLLFVFTVIARIEPAVAAPWGLFAPLFGLLALLLALLNAGIFVESAAGALPWLSVAGGSLSWLVLAVWWSHAAAAVGLLPSLLALVLLTIVMLSGHAWAHAQQSREAPSSEL